MQPALDLASWALGKSARILFLATRRSSFFTCQKSFQQTNQHGMGGVSEWDCYAVKKFGG
jgi:hypothetical protein